MKLYKYHSCENSFLITDYKKGVNFSELAKKVCLKFNTDGLILFTNDPIELIIYNQDGSKANMCGNGIRCLMHYLYNRFKVYKYLKIKAADVDYECNILSIEPMIISVGLEIRTCLNDFFNKEVFINDRKFLISSFNTGVNHLVVVSNDLNADINYLELIFNHELFNEEYNVNLVKILDNQTFEIITYEKGVGFSKSCGTGAAASAYILHTEYGLNKSMIAISQGGILKVDIEDKIILSGQTKYVSEHEIEL